MAMAQRRSGSMVNMLAKSKRRSSQMPSSLTPTSLQSFIPLVLSQSRILMPLPTIPPVSIKERQVHPSILGFKRYSLWPIGWRYLLPLRQFGPSTVSSLHMGHSSCPPLLPHPHPPPMPLPPLPLSCLTACYCLLLGLSHSMS